MNKLAIVGAGGLGRELKTALESVDHQLGEFIGFFDDGLSKGSEVDGVPVLGGINQLNSWESQLNIFIAIADPQAKQNIVVRVDNPLINYPSIIHPSSVHGDLQGSCSGLVIAANCSLTTNITIGSQVYINLNCTVGHDTMIEDYCSIMPGSNISGNVTIKQGCYIGTGAQILPGVNIGVNATVGAGSVVTKNIPAGQVWAGIPAKSMR